MKTLVSEPFGHYKLGICSDRECGAAKIAITKIDIILPPLFQITLAAIRSKGLNGSEKCNPRRSKFG
ncbi:MAG TPA: hypothetical protein VFI73_14140 [Candidatus Nitrosopolaris sp.]|nr:hypothetical protein [Candidatus Nitrosopolaris sp.]